MLSVLFFFCFLMLFLHLRQALIFQVSIIDVVNFLTAGWSRSTCFKQETIPKRRSYEPIQLQSGVEDFSTFKS